MNLHPHSRRQTASCPPKAPGLAGAARLRWVASWCVLLIYVVVATPLAPAFTALVASLDFSHAVAIRCDAHGARVVLHHAGANAPTHVHGAVARALTFFAQRSSDGDPDHSIQFNNSNATTRLSALRVAPSCDDEVKAASVQPRFLPSRAACYSQCLQPRPPPGVSGLLLSVRSTVLLI